MFRIVVPYKDRKNSSIVVAFLEEPYGKNTEPVVSVGCTLKGDADNPSWKVHVPINILEEVVEAMKEVSRPEWRQKAD